MPANRIVRVVTAIGFTCIGGLSGSPRGAAQGLSLGNVSEDRPIEISADSGIEWQQDAQVYIARGNAVVSAGPVHLSGFVGWVGWLLIHLGFLTGIRNRLGDRLRGCVVA